MNDHEQAGMPEATRLVRAGRLAEATSVLQRILGSRTRKAEQGPSDPDRPGMSGTGRAALRLREGLKDLLGRSGPREQRPAVREIDPDGGKFVAGSYANDAGTRAYKLYIPGGTGGQALPLLVMLHGCTQSPDDFARGTQMNVLAEETPCLVLYPAQSASANQSRCWNWFNPADQHRDRGEPSLIAGMTRKIMRENPVDPDRVFIAGLSAGGAAATVLAAAYPELYAALGVHSGLPSGAAGDIPSAFAAMRQGATAVEHRAPRQLVPTIVFHGDQDRTVHPRNGDLVIAQQRAADGALLQATTTTQRGQSPGGRGYSRSMHAGSDGRPLLEQWVVHGAGHAWSGGSAEGSYTDPLGPDASREMLRFFLEHPRKDASGRA